MAKSRQNGRNSKMEDLDVNREDFTGQFLTTGQGLRINDDQATRLGSRRSVQSSVW